MSESGSGAYRHKTVAGVIPARWGSTRLPGKMLAMIGDQPLIVRTYQAALRAASLDSVLVATDDSRIADAVEAVGGQAIMTDPDLPSGSDRVLAALEGIDADIVVNLQGDEPLLPAKVIDKTVRLLLVRDDFDVATAASPLVKEDLANPNAVKVVADLEGKALYFSRSQIPYPRRDHPPGPLFRRHVGIYVYRRKALEAFCSWPQSELEYCEGLEQLRLLAHGIAIGVVNVDPIPPGVDTAEDLEAVRKLFTESHKS